MKGARSGQGVAVSAKTAPSLGIRVMRTVPVLSALMIMAAIAGSCGGKSIFPSATSSSTATATTTPTTGALAYVTNFNDAKISEFKRDSASGALSSPKTVKAGAIQGPIELTVAPSLDALYVANQADNKVHEFGIAAGSGKLSPIGSGAIAAGTAPQQVAVTPNGSFAYAVNLGGANGSISEYTVNGANGALAANGTVTNGVLHPTSAIATNSFLYVADLQSGNGVVLSYAINGDGTLATPPSSVSSLGVVTASTPGPMAFDSAQAFVFVSDTTQGIVSVFSTSGGALSFVSRTLPTNSSQVGLVYAVTNTGATLLYAANQAANSVSVFSFNTVLGVLTLLGASPQGSGLSLPTGLAADPTAQFLYATNQGNGTVTQFTIDQTTGALSSATSVSTENPANAQSAPLFMAITH